MRSRFRAVLAGLFVTVGLALASTVAAEVPPAADCSVATAAPLVQPADPSRTGRVVRRVFCGEFLGPGSTAMLVVVASQGGCVSVGGWQVFSFVNGAWRPEPGGYHEVGFDAVTVDGVTITEAESLHREADWTACLGTGGTRSRAWTWNGAALAPGPWVQVRPAEPKGVVLNRPRAPKGVDAMAAFFAARNALQCGMADGRDFAGVHCEHRRWPMASVDLTASGRLKTCKAKPRTYGCGVGDPGEDPPPTLRSGESIIVGRFRCYAGRTRVRCIIISTGRGFRIDRTGARGIPARSG